MRKSSKCIVKLFHELETYEGLKDVIILTEVELEASYQFIYHFKRNREEIEQRIRKLTEIKQENPSKTSKKGHKPDQEKPEKEVISKMKRDELIKLNEEKKECQNSIEIGIKANQAILLTLSQA